MSSHMTPEEFQGHAHSVVEWAMRYQREIPLVPVASKKTPGELRAALPSTPKWDGEDFGAVLRDFEEMIVPGLTHWQHPSFFGYFPAGTSGPSILADLLASVVNVQGMVWSTSPSCTELEQTVCDWLVGLLDLPAKFHGRGVMQDTATSALLMATLAALSRLGGQTWRRWGTTFPFTCYTSMEASVMVRRVARCVGIGDERLRRVETVPGTQRMDADALRRTMEVDLAAGYVPLLVVATVGTTSTVAVDPVPDIAELCRRHDVWLHVDAAYAGAAAVCPEFRFVHAGLEHANSYSMSPHKWLLTGFDCAALWIDDPAALLNATSVTAGYLENLADHAMDYSNWQLPLGRRFRAIKLWAVLRCYGVAGLQEHIRAGVRHAEVFESLVAEDDRFRVLVPARLGVVCFGLDESESNPELIERINGTGEVFVSGTRVDGVPAIRVATGGAGTREIDLHNAWRVIRQCADSMGPSQRFPL